MDCRFDFGRKALQMLVEMVCSRRKVCSREAERAEPRLKSRMVMVQSADVQLDDGRFLKQRQERFLTECL